MKVIDLLNKIATGEEVEFKFLNSDDDIFEVENGHLKNSTCGIFLETQIDHYNWENIGYGFLNEEVEIIEDKKIEKLPILKEDELYVGYLEINQTRRKINEIIDYINREK